MCPGYTLSDTALTVNDLARDVSCVQPAYAGPGNADTAFVQFVDFGESALFEASEGHPMVPQQTGVAFSLEAEDFIVFARSLPAGIDSPSGEPLKLGDVVDFDLCWAFNLADPWGNRYELNCYDYERIKTELIEADGVEPARYWPAELYAGYRNG